MRINKFISANSEFSRRKADELISKGLVKINGEIVKKLGTQINPSKDLIEVNNISIKPRDENIYIALNKPEGYITTRSDDKNRPTVMELIPKNKNLKPAGRLDKETEGLLILSNDGTFINKLTHPSFECEKEYFAKINGQLQKAEKEKLEGGILIGKKNTSPSKINILKQSTKETSLRITIHEGRKRQIRKMFAKVNHPVKYLKRIRISKIQLGLLKKGKFRYLTKAELDVN